MASSLAYKIRYLRDRCVNAFWMLRRGDFGLIVKSAGMEFSHRYAQIRGRLQHRAIILFRSIRISLNQGRQQLTQLTRRGGDDDGIEQVHSVTEEVIPDSAFKNRRRVLPPSYCPTDSRLHQVHDLKPDPETLLAQLVDIREAVEPAHV